MALQRVAWVAVVVGCVLAIAGCATAAPSATRVVVDVPVTVDNLTDTPIGLLVDGRLMLSVAPGASGQIKLDGHDTGPFALEARSPAGTVLAMVRVNGPQFDSLRFGVGKAVGEEVGLPCGVIRLVVGTLAADEALAPAMSVAPGLCP